MRLDSKRPGVVSLFVHCQTDLVASWKARFGVALQTEGTRAVHLPLDRPLPERTVRTLLADALTYKRRKRAR